MATIKKNQTAEIPTKTGSKYTYQYVDIAQIHEYLEENNMSYYQYIDRIDNDDYIMTIKVIDGKEQPPLRGSRVVDATLFGNDNPAQKQGSALTYARRYSLLMAFGLATEDKDAQDLNILKEITIEDANNYRFSFGKYKGESIADVWDLDEGYIDWLVNNEKTDPNLIKMIDLITEHRRLPEEKMDERIELLIKFDKLVIEKGKDREKIYKHYGVDNNSKMNNEQLKDAISLMENSNDSR